MAAGFCAAIAQVASFNNFLLAAVAKHNPLCPSWGFAFRNAQNNK